MHIKAWFAARRMGLRDRGCVQAVPSEDGKHRITLCGLCHTRIRVGIYKEDGSAYRYCWRCECFIERAPPDPGEKEPLPHGESTEATVLPFQKKVA